MGRKRDLIRDDIMAIAAARQAGKFVLVRMTLEPLRFDLLGTFATHARAEAAKGEPELYVLRPTVRYGEMEMDAPDSPRVC